MNSSRVVSFSRRRCWPAAAYSSVHGCLLLLELFDDDTRRAAAELRRLHAPIGLDIGAETSEEIALSIVSEIRAVLSERSGAHLREREGTIHEITAPFPVAFEVATFAAACEV